MVVSLKSAEARQPGEADFEDWRWQVRAALTDAESLGRALQLTPSEHEGIARASTQGLPVSITPYYLSLMDRTDPACPIRRQALPIAEESIEVEGDLRDPLGEEANEVAPRLVQRYPDRVLLIATDRCSVYCRFCTRSRVVGSGEGVTTKDALADAFAWIRAHREIRDVIVSGGDPLVMATSRIASILGELAQIEHVDTVRVATRAPVTLPMRIDAELCAALREHPAVWVMTHFNHPKELTPAARAACAKLVDSGLPVMNQTVLLRGVNDDEAVLEQLFRGLVRTRVRPYYLLQMDPVRGTSHLRTPLSRGIELIGKLQGRVSGIALPKFICDTPGGKGKVPLYPNAIVREHEGVTSLKTFRGELVDYVDPPGCSG